MNLIFAILFLFLLNVNQTLTKEEISQDKNFIYLKNVCYSSFIKSSDNEKIIEESDLYPEIKKIAFLNAVSFSNFKTANISYNIEQIEKTIDNFSITESNEDLENNKIEVCLNITLKKKEIQDVFKNKPSQEISPEGKDFLTILVKMPTEDYKEILKKATDYKINFSIFSLVDGNLKIQFNNVNKEKFLKEISKLTFIQEEDTVSKMKIEKETKKDI